MKFVNEKGKLSGDHIMAHDVFISHSSKDKPLADAICAKLEEENIRCWIAPRDIGPGQDWPTAIVEAIKVSKIMVLVFSQYSNRSKQVRKELSVAVNSASIIIPFKIDRTPLEGPMELFLTDTHWLDAMNPPTERDIINLIDSVRNFLPSSMKYDSRKESGGETVDKDDLEFIQKQKIAADHRITEDLTNLEEDQRDTMTGGNEEGQEQFSYREGKNLKRALVWAGPGLIVVVGIILFLLGLGGSDPLSFQESDKQMTIPSQTLTESAIHTETPTAIVLPIQYCDSAPKSRLQIGMYAYVSSDPPLPNKVFVNPGIDQSIIGRINPETSIRIINGPECKNGWIWWYVDDIGSSLSGWTAEGDKEAYWLVPCEKSDCP